MATKRRPGNDRDAVGREAAELRRGAPGGKRFVGERAEQSQTARQAQFERVEHMAEQAAEQRRREALAAESVSSILWELFVDSYRLARSLALAPLRILGALTRSREAEA